LIKGFLMYHKVQEGALASSNISSTPKQIDDLDQFVRDTAPRYPVAVLRPHVLTQKAEEFTREFPGDVMYAVKCNPDERVLKALIAGGVKNFDCASIGEVKLIRGLMPEATIYYMHPVKSRESILEAYEEYDVNIFVLDSEDELNKIVETLDGAEDLTLFVRMAVPKQKVAVDFSAKFGASPILAAELLKKARVHAHKLGVSFHVGTHCLQTESYERAVQSAIDVMTASGVAVEALDIGGGFPANLTPDNAPPAIAEYFGVVKATVEKNGRSDLHLLCEPGRGLVASGGALVVRVELRKGDLLYLNDGTYGGIFEGGTAADLAYPVHMVRGNGRTYSSTLAGFRLAGPTCDSVDMMKGPFMLPEDINEGDWIVLDQLGAYGEVSRTNFNGFDQVIRVEQGAKQQTKGIAKAA
jgi:ornithine decarboxylase